MVAGDSFGLVLLMVVVSYAFVGFLPVARWSAVVIAAAFLSTFLAALYTSHVRGRLFLASVIVAVTIFVSVVLSAIAGTEVRDSVAFVTVLLPLTATAAVLRRVGQHRAVTAETLLGGISAYLLIGVSFASLYIAINELAGPFFVQPEVGRAQYLYFSFITLTTVGYGDLTPATDAGRVLATVEALLGQIYLVTVVAWLVSGFRSANRAADLSPDD